MFPVEQYSQKYHKTSCLERLEQTKLTNFGTPLCASKVTSQADQCQSEGSVSHISKVGVHSESKIQKDNITA